MTTLEIPATLLLAVSVRIPFTILLSSKHLHPQRDVHITTHPCRHLTSNSNTHARLYSTLSRTASTQGIPMCHLAVTCISRRLIPRTQSATLHRPQPNRSYALPCVHPFPSQHSSSFPPLNFMNATPIRDYKQNVPHPNLNSVLQPLPQGMQRQPQHIQAV